jgi:hypothetical protein
VKRLLLAAALLAASQASADMSDMPPELRKDLACMTRVLQSVPGIDDVKTGVEDVKKPTPGTYDVEMSGNVQKPDDGKQFHIEYRVQEAEGATVLRFAALRGASRRCATPKPTAPAMAIASRSG